MYAVEAFTTTALSIMDREPFPHHPTEPIAGEFYKHPYGGIARDISVSRAGFMRFFDLDEIGMKLVYHPDFYGKVLDRMFDEGEALGYRGHRHGIEHWTITIIDRSQEANIKHYKLAMEKIAREETENADKAMVKFVHRYTGREVLIPKGEWRGLRNR